MRNDPNTGCWEVLDEKAVPNKAQRRKAVPPPKMHVVYNSIKPQKRQCFQLIYMKIKSDFFSLSRSCVLEDLQPILKLAHKMFQYIFTSTITPGMPSPNTAKTTQSGCKERCLSVVHPEEAPVQLPPCHEHVLPPGGASVSSDTVQCSELQEEREVAAQTRCEPSQKGSEESQSEARWTQRGQDRARKALTNNQEWMMSLYRLRDGVVLTTD